MRLPSTAKCKSFYAILHWHAGRRDFGSLLLPKINDHTLILALVQGGLISGEGIEGSVEMMGLCSEQNGRLGEGSVMKMVGYKFPML